MAGADHTGLWLHAEVRCLSCGCVCVERLCDLREGIVILQKKKAFVAENLS